MSFPLPTESSLTLRDRVVCRCLHVKESVILELLSDPLVQTIKEIRCQTGAGDGCTACHVKLQRYLDQR
jgi:bacterioferritin-associated ferredoxin